MLVPAHGRGAPVGELVADRAPDVVLLDLMLPAVDGFDLCRELRERSAVGIIVVSARRGEQDKVRALNLGADDYMTKPFGIEELLARINAMLRRSRPGAGTDPPTDLVRLGDVDIEGATGDEGRRGGPFDADEHAFLRELVTNPGELLTHAELLRRVWGPGYETADRGHPRLRRPAEGQARVAGGPALFATEPRPGTGYHALGDLFGAVLHGSLTTTGARSRSVRDAFFRNGLSLNNE